MYVAGKLGPGGVVRIRSVTCSFGVDIRWQILGKSFSDIVTYGSDRVSPF